MTPTTSSIDSSIVDLGDQAANFGITQSAIPLDVGDSSGGVPTFNTSHAITHDDSMHAIGQQLTLDAADEGTFVGKVVSVGTPAANLMNLSAETFISNLNVEKRTYPIYRSSGIGRHIVSAAVDHWTQAAGLFYDEVPGEPILYHSCYGHDYMYSNDADVRPRIQMFHNGAANMAYNFTAGRVRMTLLPGSNGTIPLTGTEPQPALLTPVPSADSPDALVLSTGLYVDGEHSGRFNWSFISAGRGHPNPKYQTVRLDWSKVGGLSVYIPRPEGGATQEIVTNTPLNKGTYRLSIGIWADSSTRTRFTLRVHEEATGLSQTYTAISVSPLRGSQVIFTDGSVNTNATGTGGNCSMYGYYIATMKRTEFNSHISGTRKLLGQTARSISIVPGFTGDVWNNIKTLLSLHRMDLWYEDNMLRTSVRETAVRTIQEMTRPGINVTQRETARFVEVVNQRMSAHSGVPTVFHQADSVHQVATGEVEVITVQTEHSIDAVSDPVCVSGINPYPYLRGPGQYVITGSDGYIVSPNWWKDNGGSITARTTDKEGEIEITIKGPDYDSPRSPYRVSEGDAGRPALYVTGTGIKSNPITFKVPTGNPHAVEEIGETVDSPFITNEHLAYDAAAQVAQKYAAPDVTLNLTEAKHPGVPGALSRHGAGALVQYGGSTYRVGTMTHGRATNQASNASPYNTIGVVATTLGRRTIGAANQAHGGRSIKDVALKPLRNNAEAPIIAQPLDGTHE